MGKLHSYYTKLFLVVLCIVIITSGLISGMSIMRYVNSIQDITEQSLISSAEQKLKIYDVNIKGLHTLSRSIGDNEEIKKYFIKLKNGDNDKEFYNSLKIDLEQEIVSYHGLLENTFFIYNGVCIVDGLGGKSVGYDFESGPSEWYTKVKQTKKHYLGKLKKSPVSSYPVMVSAYPILDENNEILAILGLAINLNGFSNTIIYNSIDTRENTIVIDDSGTVIAANDTGLIYDYNIGEELQTLSNFIANDKEEITYYEKDGIKYIAAVKKSDLGVTIIQSLPVSTYQTPIKISILLTILISTAVIICMAFITFFIAKNITKPINVLINEFNDMAIGNYDNDIPDYLKKRSDEFATLGNALAAMKYQTSQLINNLSLANEETEASLEEVIATEDELRKQNELLTISEKNLKKSYDYNQAIIKVIPDFIFIINRDGTFTDCQASQEKLLYLPKEEFIGKNLKDIMPEEIAKTGYEKVQIALETEELQSFEYDLELEHRIRIFEIRIMKCFANSVMAISRDITEQRLYQKQIEYLSYHDQLTGLYNRRYFEDELKRLDRENYLPLCIIMADVNGLKLVNDSFGHKEGDLLLTRFAKVLQETYPSDEKIFRIGGDEFVILIPNANGERVEALVKNMLENCDREVVNAINLSVSIGWDIKSNQEEDLNTVLKSAEDFMYKKKLFEGPSMRGKTIGIIIKTLHEKNRREEQHSHRVAELCEKLADTLHMPDHEIKVIRNAGLLHDIGKIAISESVLNKPGRLTPEEFEEIKRHPEIGYRILCSSNEMTDIAEYVLSHHERWDGKGYPRGLIGEEIPFQSRIIAIADTFDAMTSERSYRMPMKEEVAAQEILRNAGTQFDPELAHRFVYEVLGYAYSEFL